MSVGGRAAAEQAKVWVRGSPTERAITKAVRNACAVVAVHRSADPEAATTALFEHLATGAPGDLRAGSAWSDLTLAVRNSLAVLWDETDHEGGTHAAAIGISCNLDELTGHMATEIVGSLGLQAEASSAESTLYCAIQIERNRLDLDSLIAAARTPMSARTPAGRQAQGVSAWVSVHSEVPTVYVMNDSDLPILNVVPTTALIAFGPDGSIVAQLGHSRLGLVRQIDPRSGWAWPMNHARSWANESAVQGQVNLSFSDATGRAWTLAHDHLIQLETP